MVFLLYFCRVIKNRTKMKFTEHPKIGDVVKLGFTIKKIVSVTKTRGDKQFTYYYLYVEKDGERRILSYNKRTKETGGSFERHVPSFGGSSKGNFKTWSD